MDRGAWQARIHGVTKSQIQLSMQAYVCVCVCVCVGVCVYELYGIYNFLILS